ncbi:MAG: hypothetical protein HY537_08295 [Deltaproteobacteria bacterium]|nr:hypothetical protein [Deltaproteobacteria bacterium]
MNYKLLLVGFFLLSGLVISQQGRACSFYGENDCNGWSGLSSLGGYQPYDLFSSFSGYYNNNYNYDGCGSSSCYPYYSTGLFNGGGNWNSCSACGGLGNSYNPYLMGYGGTPYSDSSSNTLLIQILLSSLNSNNSFGNFGGSNNFGFDPYGYSGSNFGGGYPSLYSGYPSYDYGYPSYNSGYPSSYPYSGGYQYSSPFSSYPNSYSYPYGGNYQSYYPYQYPSQNYNWPIWPQTTQPPYVYYNNPSPILQYTPPGPVAPNYYSPYFSPVGSYPNYYAQPRIQTSSPSDVRIVVPRGSHQ